MKIHYLLPLAVLLLVATSFKTDDLYTLRLCKSNEKMLFSFQVSGTKKFVSVCKDKANEYIVYRYGTRDNIEFQYPEKPDTSSWRSFMFYYVGQGGSNTSFEMVSFSFVDKRVKYDVYYNRKPEEATNEIGVNIIGNGKETNLKGELTTQMGAIQGLRQEKNIANSATGE